MSVSLFSSTLRKMMLWYVVLSAYLLTAHAEEFGVSRRTPAQSQQSSSQQILPYVVRIIAFDSSGQSFGTGSYVGSYGGYGIILTNNHVVCETKGLVHVHFPSSGFSSFGAIIKCDPYRDLALVVVSKPPQSIPMLTISQTPAKPGDPLWIVGFGSGSYRIAGGQCVRYLTLPNQTDEGISSHEIVEVSVSARKGDSGGPILNQKGELAGVLFGSDMIRNTAGSYCERVNRFLTEAQNEVTGLPSRPETHFATVEKNGPLHTLQESRNTAPQNSQGTIVPQRTGLSDPSTSPFGVRSSSRRYIAPATNERLSQPQAPQREQAPAMIRKPLSSLTPIPETEQAVWAKASPKFGMSYKSVQIVQTAHLIPLETIDRSVAILSADPSAKDRYRLKLSADRSDRLFTLFLSLNVCIATGLTCCAVRLLHV